MEQRRKTGLKKRRVPAECHIYTSSITPLKIGLSWVKEGLSAGGGDAALLSINLCVVWASHIHTHEYTHSGRNLALLFIFQKLFCGEYTDSNIVLCTCVAFIFFSSLRLDLCTAPCSVLCIAFVCFHSRYMFILLSSSSEALTHLWSGLIVTTHSFKCFQFCCGLKQQPFKIVSLCFSCGYLAALQLDSMLCISESETVSVLHRK